MVGAGKAREVVVALTGGWKGGGGGGCELEETRRR